VTLGGTQFGKTANDVENFFLYTVRFKRKISVFNTLNIHYLPDGIFLIRPVFYWVGSNFFRHTQLRIIGKGSPKDCVRCHTSKPAVFEASL